MKIRDGRRNKRAALLGALTIGAVLLPALPAWSDTGYHHVHYEGDERRRGIYWTTEITNPATVPGGTSGNRDHFVAPSWMREAVNIQSTCVNANELHWIESGWGERGDLLYTNGNPYRFAYGFDSIYCQWVIVPNMFLSPGETVSFKIVPTGTEPGCAQGYGWCTWKGSVKRNGTWTEIYSALVPFGNDLFPDIGSEPYNGYSGTHWTLSGGDGDIDVANVELREANGSWVSWDESYLGADIYEDPWYDIRFDVRFRKFYTYL